MSHDDGSGADRQVTPKKENSSPPGDCWNEVDATIGGGLS